MLPDLVTVLNTAPDLKDRVKKTPEGVVKLNQARDRIREELENYKAKSILYWKRQTGVRIFARGENIEAGHLEIDVNRYGDEYFITVNNIPASEENIIDKGSLGDMFKLYVLQDKIVFVNDKSERLELPADTYKLIETDFFKDLYLDGSSDCCQLTWRTTMRVIEELEKNNYPVEHIKSIREFYEREISSWPYQLIFDRNRLTVTNRKVKFEMDIPPQGIPLKHDSLVEFMGFLTGLTGTAHSDSKQLENLNKLNDITPDKIIEYLEEAKEQALLHTDPKYAKDLYDKLTTIKFIEDPESGDILVAVPLSEEELLKVKKEIVKMLKEGVPKENLPAIMDENRRKLGISNCFVPIQVTPIWCGMTIYVTPEKEYNPILTTRLLNQLKTVLKRLRVYFEETEISEEEAIE